MNRQGPGKIEKCPECGEEMVDDVWDYIELGHCETLKCLSCGHEEKLKNGDG